MKISPSPSKHPQENMGAANGTQFALGTSLIAGPIVAGIG